MKPQVTEYYNRGTKYLMSGNYEKALSMFKKETGVCKELYLNMGNTYRKLGDFQKAGECYVKSCRDDVYDFNGVGGLYAPGLCNLGLLYYGNGQDSEAILCYKEALEIDASCYDAIWNCSTALLRTFCSGGPLNPDAWAMYQYRFKSVKGIDTRIPLWDYSSKGRILVLAEQGLGDKLMWGRYVRKMVSLGFDVTVQLPKVLFPIFSEIGCKCVEDYDISEYDYSVPIADLASHYGIISGSWITGWKPKTDSKPVVCVEWAGSTTHLNDKYRSCYNIYFKELAAKFPDITFINVRPDSVKVPGIEKISGGNFGSTVETLKGVDLVISVDTSIVHLSGSMGIETWMMQPLRETDFRWGLSSLKREYGMDVEKNIWYSSVKVLDNIGWDKMFAEIAVRLKAWELERHVKMLAEGIPK